jgi:hypothetical protein
MMYLDILQVLVVGGSSLGSYAHGATTPKKLIVANEKEKP